MYHMCVNVLRDQRALGPLELMPLVVAGNKLDPLQEHQVLLTIETSLQFNPF